VWMRFFLIDNRVKEILLYSTNEICRIWGFLQLYECAWWLCSGLLYHCILPICQHFGGLYFLASSMKLSQNETDVEHVLLLWTWVLTSQNFRGCGMFELQILLRHFQRIQNADDYRESAPKTQKTNRVELQCVHLPQLLLNSKKSS
jgi:hypothetical protein